MQSGISIEHIILGLVSIYGIYYFFETISNQIIENKIHKNKILQADHQISHTLNDLVLIKKKIIGLIKKEYGSDEAKKFEKGELWEGMPVQLLVINVGKPDSVVKKKKRKEQVEIWQYKTFTNKLRKLQHTFMVVISDGVVTSWKGDYKNL
jgi:hypothetical protein